MKTMDVEDISAMLYGMYPQAGLGSWVDFNQYVESSHLWRNNAHHGECQGLMEVKCWRCLIANYRKLAARLKELVESSSDKKLTLDRLLRNTTPEERHGIVKKMLGKQLVLIGY